MKKIVLLIIFILGVIVVPVNADSYKLNELIPTNTETTIVTNNFSYKGLYYSNNNYIVFRSIKNLNNKDIPISIRVAFFNKDKNNIGIMNYCSTKESTTVDNNLLLKGKEERSYAIEVTKEYIAKEYSLKDIKYISILSDNENCYSGPNLDGVGRKIDKLGKSGIGTLDSSSELAIIVFSIIAILLVVLFLYRFLFTTYYSNFDGDDIRTGYKKYNKRLKKEREREARLNPEIPKEKPKVKTDEVIMQEEMAKHEDENGTDLHNLYK